MELYIFRLVSSDAVNKKQGPLHQDVKGIEKHPSSVSCPLHYEDHFFQYSLHYFFPFVLYDPVPEYS